MPEPPRAELVAVRPTIDLDPTDIEVYGPKKEGMAYNYAGQRCGRAHPAVWAEAGVVLAADLGSGRDDPRPQAPLLIARSVAWGKHGSTDIHHQGLGPGEDACHGEQGSEVASCAAVVHVGVQG